MHGSRGESDQPLADAAGRPVPDPDASSIAARVRGDLRLAGDGPLDPRASDLSRRDAERLLTDGAALVFQLESERLSVERHYRDALLAVAAGELAAEDALVLHRRQRDVEAEIDELRRLLAAARRRFAPRSGT